MPVDVTIGSVCSNLHSISIIAASSSDRHLYPPSVNFVNILDTPQTPFFAYALCSFSTDH